MIRGVAKHDYYIWTNEIYAQAHIRSYLVCVTELHFSDLGEIMFVSIFLAKPASFVDNN